MFSYAEKQELHHDRGKWTNNGDNGIGS